MRVSQDGTENVTKNITDLKSVKEKKCMEKNSLLAVGQKALDIIIYGKEQNP